MTIRREDLDAAASVGLLQYRQVDPLLVFLLQRDVRAQRLALAAQAREQARVADRSWVHVLLFYIAAFLAIVTVGLFAVKFTSQAVHAVGGGGLVFLVLVYMLAAVGLGSWFKRRGYPGKIRMLMAVTLASVPLAVFALQQVSV